MLLAFMDGAKLTKELVGMNDVHTSVARGEIRRMIRWHEPPAFVYNMHVYILKNRN